MVLGGQCASLDTVGRLVYATRQSGGDLQVFDYRGALPDTGASTVMRIGPEPTEAVRVLREQLASPAPGARIAPVARPASASAGAS
jgi:hypothetical protein